MGKFILFSRRADDGDLTVHFNVHVGQSERPVAAADVEEVLKREIQAAAVKSSSNATALAPSEEKYTPEERQAVVVAGSVLSGLAIREESLEIHGKRKKAKVLVLGGVARVWAIRSRWASEKVILPRG